MDPRTCTLSPALCLSLALLLSACASAPPDDYRPRLSQQLEETLTPADIQAEVDFGRHVAASILGRMDGLDNDAVQRYVNLVGQTVARASRRPELDFYFYVLESDQVNAYAAPGGYVFITRPALALMRDESELAAVLAHEIAHVDQRHIVRALDIGATGSDAGLAQLMGGASETTRVVFDQAVDQALSILFEKGLERQDELEADAQGAILLASTGYDPGALRRYLDRVHESGTDQHAELSGTHPPFDVRLAALDRQLHDEGLTGLDYPRLAERFRDRTQP
ncbi:M48 family metalloprotease [Saccharospirillum salsuginis]|uniref:Peptidase M48 domain-containing protein n=1 Tax=Saccharospirillum salsuginis TaxID=418750 RepID=A0A918NCE3_9GAMM|nr:M48 family metalloprotease [Saccharospirillum salsuginis]GGX58019.1 hypothetical protein GCM10007392_27170 [Saccharospirillum salsuginis]